MGYVELCFLQIPGLYGALCQYNVFNADPTTGRWYSAFRWITVVWVSFLFLISGGALIYSRWQKRKRDRVAADEKNQLVSNVQDLMLGTICAASLDTFLYHTIDPGPGFFGIMPPMIGQIFFSLQLSFLAAIFAILIFHWIEIYIRTVNVLKREEMLSKINSNYESNVTLQDITSKVTGLNRIKIPMIAVTILTFLVSLAQAIALQHNGVAPPEKKKVMTFWGVYFFIVYGVESLGFVIIGNYMVTILPAYLQHRMKAITIKFSILALAYLFVFVFTWTMFTYYVAISQPWVYLISDLIGFWVLEIVVSVVLSRFVTLVPRYPFLQMVGMAQTSASGGTGKTKSKSGGSGKSGQEVAIEMETEDSGHFDNIPKDSSEV